MFKSHSPGICACFGAVLLLGSAISACGAPRKSLDGQLPPAAALANPLNVVPATNELRLSLSLPVRDQAALDAFLRSIYDPASPEFHRYLTPAQFTEKFGPAETEYRALIGFVESNGLKVVSTHPNRLVLDVSGPVASVENTFRLKFHQYQHPQESRIFYSADTNPSIDASLPFRILSIGGLDNFSQPHPASLHMTPPNPDGGARPNAGSGPAGQFLGRDFRLAYLPGNRLNGSGQSIALLEFDGYYSNDITAYETAGSLPPVPLANVAVNGGVSSPGAGNVEVALDIEMAISMATNLSKVIVYEAPSGTPWFSLLSQMANDNLAAQISCSWYRNTSVPDPACEQVFQQMAAQGQSFFTASGDYDAFVGFVPFPDDSPNITIVGGTVLTTAARGGTRASEVVWNRGLDTTSGNYVGTGGGVSFNYAIPAWQQGINSFLTNGGSLVARNVPDVALTAENIYVKADNGMTETVGGTSCAAPLWAGVMALANQQSVTAGKPVVGFINPIIYELANESIYTNCFFDITVGSNAWPSSGASYNAVPGYDLCTGLGVPRTTNLINALVSPDPLIIVSNGGFNTLGTAAGAFGPVAQTYFLTNGGTSPLTWSLGNTPVWLTASKTSGTLAAGAGDALVVSLSQIASNLMANTYTAKLWFTNVTSGVAHSRFFTLTTTDALVIQAPASQTFFGPPGGPFQPAAYDVVLTNPSPHSLDFGVNNTSIWLNISPTGASLAGQGQSTLTVTPSALATNLSDGLYSSVIRITNLTSQYVQALTVVVSVGIVQNGGFETGDFSQWNLVGRTFDSTNVYNGVVGVNSLADGSGPNFIHSGNYGAFLGDTSLATLSQTLTITPGQNYRLSFWLDNPVSGSGQQFAATWIANGVTNQLYSVVNPSALAWTNLTFDLTAAGTNGILQFLAANPPDGFGLDDISLVSLTPPVITLQPTNLTVPAGSNAVFIGSARGVGSLIYQWLKNGTNLLTGGNVSGATTNMLVISPAALGDVGSYQFVVTNNYGSATSSIATITVALPPSIGTGVVNPNGSLGLSLSGTPGYTCVLLASTNLSTWLPIATNVLDAKGSWQFADLTATNSPLRFYRTQVTP